MSALAVALQRGNRLARPTLELITDHNIRFREIAGPNPGVDRIHRNAAVLGDLSRTHEVPHALIIVISDSFIAMFLCRVLLAGGGKCTVSLLSALPPCGAVVPAAQAH